MCSLSFTQSKFVFYQVTAGAPRGVPLLMDKETMKQEQSASRLSMNSVEASTCCCLRACYRIALSGPCTSSLYPVVVRSARVNRRAVGRNMSPICATHQQNIYFLIRALEICYVPQNLNLAFASAVAAIIRAAPWRGIPRNKINGDMAKPCVVMKAELATSGTRQRRRILL